MALGFLALALILNGCASGDTGDRPFDFLAGDENAKLTPEERRLRDDAAEFNETVAGGAATGALLLGGLCMVGVLLNGGDGLGQCAIRAGVGAAIGAVDGYLVAKRQEAARQRVREIDLVTKELEDKNVKLQQLVDSSRRVVEQNRTRIQDVQLKVAQKKMRQEQLVQEQAQLQSNIDLMNQTIANLTRERDNYQQVAGQLGRDGRNTAALEKQIRTMEQQIAALQVERDELEKIKRAVRLG